MAISAIYYPLPKAADKQHVCEKHFKLGPDSQRLMPSKPAKNLSSALLLFCNF